jgi:hypothetical protein
MLLVGTALLGSVAPALADEEPPDAEFLEYLGFWEESDEEWLLFDTAADDTDTMRNDPAPQGEESMENDDED